jgi:hypothetical protein
MQKAREWERERARQRQRATMEAGQAARQVEALEGALAQQRARERRARRRRAGTAAAPLVRRQRPPSAGPAHSARTRTCRRRSNVRCVAARAHRPCGSRRWLRPMVILPANVAARSPCQFQFCWLVRGGLI